MKVVHSWLKEYVGERMPTPEKLEELLTFHAFEIDGVEEINGEVVLDVKVLPDRSSDCLSHRGIAREIATLIDTALVHDPLAIDPILDVKTDAITLTIENTDACRRFTVALITGVTVTQSPEWLRTRIEALGQRSINNVVDATNYVMYALGQPLHAYDARKLSHPENVWHLTARMAKEGEGITTLTGDEYALDSTIQLIVDAHTETPVGIAGIKGGIEALVDSQTTALIVEAANFDPVITRKATQALKLSTDASKRFENAVSPTLAPYALKEVVALICKITGGMCDGYVDVYPKPLHHPSVSCTHAHIEALLGLSISREKVENILNRLGFHYTYENDTWTITPPHERTDITIAEDVIEEIGRVYGYEHVRAVPPAPVPLTEYNARHYYSEKVRGVLIAHGFSEIITSSFRKKDTITLLNALASDKGSLRSALHKNIEEALNKNMPNLDLLGLDQLQIFELGTVFGKTEDGTDVHEHVSLSLGVRTKQQGYTPKDDERLKEVVIILETALGVPFHGVLEKGIFECDFTSVISRLPVPTTYDPYVTKGESVFTPYSPYPFVSRDIALWVPEGTTTEMVISQIKMHGGNLLTSVRLFDAFKKEDKISYALRLIFQSMERTLTDDEVGTCMQEIEKACRTEGYIVR